MMRVCGLPVAVLALCSAQLSGQPKVPAQGSPPEIQLNDAEEMIIRREPTVWRVDISGLIRNEDCAWRIENNKAICAGPPTAPCRECRRGFSLIGWDSHYERVYFGLSTGISQNNPWTIFNYSLKTRTITRFTNTWAATIHNGVVSRSGRYLAYLNFGHGGLCANSSAVEIVDLWNRRVAKPNVTTGDNDEITDVMRIDWVSASLLEYEAVTNSYAACREGTQTERSVTGRIDVAALGFN